MAAFPPGSPGGSPSPTRSRGRHSALLLAIVLLATAPFAGCAGDLSNERGTGDGPTATGPRPWASSDEWWSVTPEAVSEPDLYLTYIQDVDVDSRGRVFLVDAGKAASPS